MRRFPAVLPTFALLSACATAQQGGWTPVRLAKLGAAFELPKGMRSLSLGGAGTKNGVATGSSVYGYVDLGLPEMEVQVRGVTFAGGKVVGFEEMKKTMGLFGQRSNVDLQGELKKEAGKGGERWVQAGTHEGKPARIVFFPAKDRMLIATYYGPVAAYTRFVDSFRLVPPNPKGKDVEPAPVKF